MPPIPKTKQISAMKVFQKKLDVSVKQKSKRGKTTWNNRVIENDGVFNIYEVFYTGKKPHSWTTEPVYPQGETIFELGEDLARMMLALSSPVLKIVKNKLIQKS